MIWLIKFTYFNFMVKVNRSKCKINITELYLPPPKLKYVKKH